MPQTSTQVVGVDVSVDVDELVGKPMFTVADLKAVADSYDPATAQAPIVVGHPNDNAPAFGSVESFSYDATKARLPANLMSTYRGWDDVVDDNKNAESGCVSVTLRTNGAGGDNSKQTFVQSAAKVRFPPILLKNTVLRV